MTDTTLGQRIAERRKLLGLSQESFGEKMGISRQAISKWEADNSTPEVEKLITMSKLFGVSVDWLLGTEEEEEPFQIAAAFRMPRQEPVTPPPAPEPEQEIADPEPPAEEPEAKKLPLNWLNILCAAVAVISLVLSIISMNRSMDTGSDHADPDLAYQVSQLEEQLADAKKQLADLNKIDDHYALLIHETGTDIRDLQQDLDSMMALLENYGKPENPPANILPTYNGLSSWSMNAQLADTLDQIKILFRAIPSEELKGIRFIAEVNGEKVETDCDVSEGIYTAELYVTPADGYRYILILKHLDGTEERITLEGHGLANLTKPSDIGMVLEEWEESIFNDAHNETSFWIGWQAVFLQTPDLTPEGAHCEWSNLQISHYYNGVPLEQQVLEQYLKDVDLRGGMIHFTIPSLTYKLPYLLDGDRHELRMEGTLIIDGVAKDFSFPMAKWVIEQQKMVRQ